MYKYAYITSIQNIDTNSIYLLITRLKLDVNVRRGKRIHITKRTYVR